MPTDDEIAEKIRTICSTDDEEMDHISADDILCELLTALGYVKTVEAYEAVGKWYA